MKLQLALDIITIPEAKKLLKEIEEHIDIVEIGTPFIINEGLKAVREIKKEFPSKEVLADLKIMDAGKYETMKAVQAGADIVTVLGVSDDITIKASLKEAKKQRKSIMIDMINVKNLEERAKEIDALGVDYICIHTGTDVQTVGIDPLEELLKVKSVVKNAKIAVAGGIKLSTLPQIIKAKPDVVIVGSGITGQEDKRTAALEFKKLINQGV